MMTREQDVWRGKAGAAAATAAGAGVVLVCSAITRLSDPWYPRVHPFTGF